MKDLKLTSPGLMLIVATILAGGIFLLDLFYLQPQLTGQRQAALRDQAARVEQAGRAALRTEQEKLTRSCLAWSDSAELRSTLAGNASFDALAIRAFAPAEVELAWLCNADGEVLSAWSAAPKELKVDKAQLARSIAELGKVPLRGEGVLSLKDWPVLFAQWAVKDPLTNTTAGRLWLARRLDARSLEGPGSATGSNMIFVRSEVLPMSTIKTDSKAAFWMPDGEDGNLAVSWLVYDSAGKCQGQFQVKSPVAQIYKQASSTRRAILIVLSLSMGLVLLIIMGTHMLVAGPVVRLLKRLQSVEIGAGSPADLTRKLHGEPLVLARRLESAFQKLDEMSKKDLLTGLSNRRHFEEVLDCFYHQSRRYNRPLSLMIIDVDYFKAVNDTGGHQLGDELLKRVAAHLEKTCRKADLPARWGGDEFTVLLPETTSIDAAEVAQRLAESLAEESFTVRNSQMKITLSIGVADLNSGEIDSAEAMVALADRALYVAKEHGRNRVVQANDINGLTWPGSSENSGHVNSLFKKLANLDNHFKGLFLSAVEDVVEILEQRDPHMALHARKVQHFAVMIGREMELPDRVIGRLEIAAMLHDIGMIALPDSILLAPQRLNEQQLQVLRRHPLLSVRIMEGMEFLEQEIPAVRYHHERYDGRGYPEGLKGAEIPLTARVLAVADAFVAITSQRPFRTARSIEQAKVELRSGSGTQFDPAVVEAFFAAADKLGDKLLDIPELKDPPSIMHEALETAQV